MDVCLTRNSKDDSLLALKLLVDLVLQRTIEIRCKLYDMMMDNENIPRTSFKRLVRIIGDVLKNAVWNLQ